MKYLSKIDKLDEAEAEELRHEARYAAVREMQRHHGLYRFTTEDIDCYLDALAPAGRRCLTVASSGDQAVNLLMAGASEVVMFDVVEEALYGTAFKMAALCEADDGDPDRFLGRYLDWLKPAAFRRVRKRLGERERLFFDGHAAIADDPADAFFKPYSIYGVNPYVASREAFAAARSAVARAMEGGTVSTVVSDVRSLPHVPRIGTFDVIVLSDVVGAIVASTRSAPLTLGETQWRANDLDVDGIVAMVRSVTWPLAAMLRPGGAMVAHYVHGVPWEEDGWGGESEADLRHPETRRRAFEPPPGFTVGEIRTGCCNSEDWGDDVAVIFRRQEG